MTGKAYGLMMTREAAEGNRAAVRSVSFAANAVRSYFCRKLLLLRFSLKVDKLYNPKTKTA